MPLLNGDFENWVAGAPVGWTLGGNDTYSWTQESTTIKHGTYGLRLDSCCFDAIAWAKQEVDAIPYRGKTITVKAWGNCNSRPDNDLYVGVNGTGGWSTYDRIDVNWVWEEKSVSGVVPVDATLITIQVRISSGPIRDGLGYWDWVTMSPIAITKPATGVQVPGATLNGVLTEDGGEDCDCGFEWGETIAYGNTTPTESKGRGELFEQRIEGLESGTTYHFRAIATNSVETVYGDDQEFTTPEVHYHLSIKDVNLPYEDKDSTKELHILLKNLSPTSKLAGLDGEVVIEVKYEPAT